MYFQLKVGHPEAKQQCRYRQAAVNPIAVLLCMDQFLREASLACAERDAHRALKAAAAKHLVKVTEASQWHEAAGIRKPDIITLMENAVAKKDYPHLRLSSIYVEIQVAKGLQRCDATVGIEE